MKTSVQSSRAGVFLVGTLVLVACSGGAGASSGASAAAGGASNTPAAAASSDAGGSGRGVSGAAGASPARPRHPPAAGPDGGATGGSVTDAQHLADLLGPGDFSAAGVPGAGTPTVNPGDPGSVFVVYAGKSGGTGGIEFDAVLGDTADDMGTVFGPMSAAVPRLRGRRQGRPARGG